MKFFIDTANVEEIRKANDSGSDLRSYDKSVPDRKKREKIMLRP